MSDISQHLTLVLLFAEGFNTEEKDRWKNSEQCVACELAERFHCSSRPGPSLHTAPKD